MVTVIETGGDADPVKRASPLNAADISWARGVAK